MKMYEELIKVAEAQLPKATADVLKQRLDLVDTLESQLNSVRDQLRSKQECLDALRAEQNKFLQAEAVLQEAETKLAEAITIKEEFWKKEMELKLECANAKTGLVTEFTKGLVRNVEFRSSVLGNSNGYNGSGHVTNSNHSHTDTKTIE